MGAATHLVRKAAAAASARPVTWEEFTKVWRRIRPKPLHTRFPTIGLAISGGVDSMALAVLCSAMKKGLALEDANLNFRAFIVDHGVRSGSDVEALAVSRNLEKIGIPSDVLKMEWPSSLQTTGLPNFESSARKYRFPALGKACREWGIDSLLMAHHEDDQVETIMMRLMDGHRTGLKGIREHCQIPECYGMHGVYESTGLDNPASKGREDQKSQPSRKVCLPQLQTETGGVAVYRPLLGFSKERLIATCKNENIAWFEDHTNKDRTLTKRNAVRHMRAHHALPKALGREALLNLSESIKQQEQRRQEVLGKWLSKCPIMMFNLNGGTARVRFPNLDAFKDDELWWPGENAGHTAAELLSRVLMLVTPRDHISLPSLHGAVARVFPELSGEEPQMRPFTVCGVYFQPVEQSPAQPDSPREAAEAEDGPHPEAAVPVTRPAHDSKPTWIISRETLAGNEIAKQILTFQPAQPSPTTTESQWSPFQLFDRRYWVRILATDLPPSTSIHIKPLTPTHWRVFKVALGRELGRRFPHVVRTIKERASGKALFTLPALVWREAGADGEVEEKVVALPTLGIGLKGSSERVQVEVRYKKIYTDGMVIEGWKDDAGKGGREPVRRKKTFVGTGQTGGSLG